MRIGWITTFAESRFIFCTLITYDLFFTLQNFNSVFIFVKFSNKKTIKIRRQIIVTVHAFNFHAVHMREKTKEKFQFKKERSVKFRINLIETNKKKAF